MADDLDDAGIEPAAAAVSAGFIKFYGLYWHKSHVEWASEQILGQPNGWTGKGKLAADYDRSKLQMNFWLQKGVYVLYDAGLQPVYAGQAGLKRGNAAQDAGRSIGMRLRNHAEGHYRNGWQLFSWFGFLDTRKIELKKSDEKTRLTPPWNFAKNEDAELNLLLASFEAILIEGFSPRFNSRGGDLKGATIVRQFEPQAKQI